MNRWIVENEWKIVMSKWMKKKKWVDKVAFLKNENPIYNIRTNFLSQFANNWDFKLWPIKGSRFDQLKSKIFD